LGTFTISSLCKDTKIPRALKLKLERCIHEIKLEPIHKVTGNWVHRIRSYKQNRVGHLNDLLFKT